MKKNLAIAILLILLVGTVTVSLLASSSMLTEKEARDAEVADIAKWKECVSQIEIWKLEEEELIKLADLRNCD